MAHTATASKGFEFHRYVQEGEILYIPGDPGDTFEEGYAGVATVGEGIMDLLAGNEGGMVGRAEKKTVCPANTTAWPTAKLDPATDAYSACLVPVRPCIKAGTPVYKVTFANHYDDVVASYSAASRYIELTTGCGADDRPAGALVYVYEGTGMGQIGVCESYDHTGGTVEKMLVLHRAFQTALDATSKVIILAGEAAGSRGVGFFNRCEAGGAGTVTVNQGADDGDYLVYMDWREAADHLKNLMLLVVPARYEALA